MEETPLSSTQPALDQGSRREKDAEKDCGENVVAYMWMTLHVSADTWHLDEKEENQRKEIRKNRESSLYLMCQHFEGWLLNDYMMTRLLYLKCISHSVYHIWEATSYYLKWRQFTPLSTTGYISLDCATKLIWLMQISWLVSKATCQLFVPAALSEARSSSHPSPPLWPRRPCPSRPQ